MSGKTHDAVLFDFYGTLTQAVQRGPGHHRVAELLGCPIDELTALLDRSFYARARGETGGPLATLCWIADQLGLHVTRRQLREAQAARVAAITADTRLRADAVATLRRCRGAGLRVALVSDCCWELPDLLTRLPVAPLLDTAIFSVHIGACKPDPTIYLAACAALRVSPDRCLYLGDGSSQELTGAAALGMTAFRLAAPDLAGHLTFRPDDEFRGPAVTSLSRFADVATGVLQPDTLAALA
ncbi:putative hydrolase of the HAD superfamily [Allocatelliglobosispora scoriae]|uniref:Putative hydrolase of the HAD superfamily n=1 Tax=Allocatelliglobosispora scoriae TaxID=643052 RepID=A0A841BSX0_9ACTN|nr:HAD-IA family hydrolase [Allocatelliglobosispora scoriae]MBB5870496.1 putative hydrolase of the HAD superfamily [Allocatelliglobosispora scoriae]